VDRPLPRGTRRDGDPGTAFAVRSSAVVGCDNATARLHTGERVLVDGAQGTVEIVEEL
jgi:phosphoenolpyruvate-protein kinase (PTS system EI component)